MSRLELEGELQRLVQKKLALVLKGRNMRDGIVHLLISPNTPLGDINARGVKSLASDLVEVQLEFNEVLDQIKELNKELNG